KNSTAAFAAADTVAVSVVNKSVGDVRMLSSIMHPSLDLQGSMLSVGPWPARPIPNSLILLCQKAAGVVARRVDARPPFSALLTLWLSMIAAVGLASQAAASRHFTQSASWMRSSVPSQLQRSK